MKKKYLPFLLLFLFAFTKDFAHCHSDEIDCIEYPRAEGIKGLPGFWGHEQTFYGTLINPFRKHMSIEFPLCGRVLCDYKNKNLSEDEIQKKLNALCKSPKGCKKKDGTAGPCCHGKKCCADKSVKCQAIW